MCKDGSALILAFMCVYIYRHKTSFRVRAQRSYCCLCMAKTNERNRISRRRFGCCIGTGRVKLRSISFRVVNSDCHILLCPCSQIDVVMDRIFAVVVCGTLVGVFLSGEKTLGTWE